MDAIQTNIQTAIAQQASEWFVAHRGGELSPQERKAFTAWLRTSPLHVREYLAVAKMARDFNHATREPAMDVEQLIAAANEESSESVAVSPLVHGERVTSSVSRRRSIPWLVAAALAAFLVVRYFVDIDSLETAHGEQRIWRLADGSVVHLNSGSKLSIRFSDAERRIEILRGQALFDVARDATRPFRVQAGDTQVTAVGTAFDVYLKSDETLVTVVEGRVQVAEQGQTPSIEVPIHLTAGEQLALAPNKRRSADAPPDRAAQPTLADVAKATAWTQQQIMFDQERLADVAREFNRYGRTPIAIDGAALAGLRITGIFNAYDTDSFLDFLRKLDEVEVDVSQQRIRVSKNSGT